MTQEPERSREIDPKVSTRKIHPGRSPARRINPEEFAAAIGAERIPGNKCPWIWENNMPTEQKVHDRNLSIRRMLLPKDTNHRGEIFGGAILAEIDLAGAIEARRHTRHDVATVAVKEVVFKHPVQVGDVVSFWTKTIKVGETSIHVQVDVESSRDGTGTSVSVTAAEVVYVAIAKDTEGKIHKVSVGA